MIATSERPVGTPTGALYAADMARSEFMGLEEARQKLGPQVDKANAQDPTFTVLTKHGKPLGAVVSFEFLMRAREALGEAADV